MLNIAFINTYSRSWDYCLSLPYESFVPSYLRCLMWLRVLRALRALCALSVLRAHVPSFFTCFTCLQLFTVLTSLQFLRALCVLIILIALPALIFYVLYVPYMLSFFYAPNVPSFFCVSRFYTCLHFIYVYANKADKN